MEIARRHGLFVLEDAAEAHGAEYKGRRVGSIGDAATFSFFGNKIITTGEGGMVTTNDRALADEVRRLKNHGMDPQRKYWFPTVGYNYRLTNVASAIGLAQLEKIDWHLEQRQLIASWYREFLAGVPGLSWQAEKEWARHVWWLFTVVIDEEIPVGPLRRAGPTEGSRRRGASDRLPHHATSSLPRPRPWPPLRSGRPYGGPRYSSADVVRPEP